MKNWLRGSLVRAGVLCIPLLMAACTPVQPIVRDGAGQAVPIRNDVIGDIHAVAESGIFDTPIDAAPDPDGNTFYFTATSAQGPGVFQVSADGGDPAPVYTGAPFANIFGIKELDEQLPDNDTALHIATVQGMVKRLLYPSGDQSLPPVDQYDCIIVDECHRGYLLDRELSDTELSFRDFDEYISKYRRVLDYFDAVKIGLTATPAQHTSEIFGKPIFNYSYREAVIDGYLVDHEPPIQIKTQLSIEGIHWQAGETIWGDSKPLSATAVDEGRSLNPLQPCQRPAPISTLCCRSVQRPSILSSRWRRTATISKNSSTIARPLRMRVVAGSFWE